MRFEKQISFDVNLRLRTWKRRAIQYGNGEEKNVLTTPRNKSSFDKLVDGV